jgi:hypothetical protein
MHEEFLFVLGALEIYTGGKEYVEPAKAESSLIARFRKAAAKNIS